MELPQFTRASMFLRLVCGLWLVGSAMAAGFMLRSPWIVGPLGLAFAVLFVIGKWTAWKQSIQTLGWKSLPTGLLTLIPSQIVIVGIFYAPCLGFMKLTKGERAIAPYGSFDTQYAALVLLIGAALGIGAHLLEVRVLPNMPQLSTPSPGDET